MSPFKHMLSKSGAAILLLPLVAGFGTVTANDTALPRYDERAALTLPVDLGMSGMFAVLAKSGVSTVPTSDIRNGYVGVSPAAASSITGFALVQHPSGKYSTSSQVMQKVFAADYAPPTPILLGTAVLDMEAAYTEAANRNADFLEVGTGNIGGMNLGPGVYKWTTGLLIPTDVTLTGDADDVWIFQIAQGLTVGSAAKVILAGGARPKNVFWQVTGIADIGTTAEFHGNILCATAITVKTNATICGRLLAQTAVTLDANLVRMPRHH